MSLRSALGQVRGLGSAKQGVNHWWRQRLTAIALVPLTLWFVVSLISKATADYATVSAWVAYPPVTVFLVALILAMFYHAKLGLQVVFEDYVHTEWRKFAVQIAVNFIMALLALAALLAILRISLGAA